jgi:hypothetical protein
MTGPPELILGVLLGRLALGEAESRGLKYQGDRRTTRRLRPA